jgi:tetratricopeptide (TPR) repeat protein
MGQLIAAIADYDAALKLRPDDAHTLYGRGLAYQRKGDTEAGNADLERAKGIDPKIEQTYGAYGLQP